MRRFRLLAGSLCLLLAFAAVGCDDDETTSGMMTLSAAPLSGANEVPANTSTATGSAMFEVNESTVQYTIQVQGMADVTVAHIHSGASGTAGSPRVTLFTGPTAGPVNGTLVQATFTSTDVQGIAFDELINEIRAGTAYVNVHSTAFPDGEIRAQLAVVE